MSEEDEPLKCNNSSLSADLAAALNPLNSCCWWSLLRRRLSLRRIPSGSSFFFSGSSSLTATTVLVTMVGLESLPQIMMDPARTPPTNLPLPPTLSRDTEAESAGRELGQEDSEDALLYQELVDFSETLDAILTAFNELTFKWRSLSQSSSTWSLNRLLVVVVPFFAAL